MLKDKDMLRTKDLRKKSKEDLQKLLKQNLKKLQELRFDLAFNRLKDISLIKKTKKEIARIKTLLNEK